MAEQTLRDKVIVLTGASSGFGKGVARRVGASGASVVLAARRGELLDDLAREIESSGGRAISVPTDVSKQEDVANLAESAISSFGRIDVWINNAGAGAVGRFTEVPLEEHVQVIETDLLGVLYGSYRAMQHFLARHSGILINVSSVIGKVPSPYFASYAAAKHGVIGLSSSIRQELQEAEENDIHVCTVMPTSFDTPFFEHASGHTGHEVAPIPPVYEPERVVETITDLITNPKDEVSVGTAAAVSIFMHQIAPKIMERMMARQTHKAEFEKAKPAQSTKGGLEEPSPSGTTVTGGWKKS
jgi:short-subunit dehydrogenase